MNKFALRIEKNLRRKERQSGAQAFEDISFSLIKKTSMSLTDIMEAPTPLILSLHSKLHKYYADKAKQMKKNSRK